MSSKLVAVTDSVFPSLDPARQLLAKIEAELRLAKVSCAGGRWNVDLVHADSKAGRPHYYSEESLLDFAGSGSRRRGARSERSCDVESSESRSAVGPPRHSKRIKDFATAYATYGLW